MGPHEGERMKTYHNAGNAGRDYGKLMVLNDGTNVVFNMFTQFLTDLPSDYRIYHGIGVSLNREQVIDLRDSLHKWLEHTHSVNLDKLIEGDKL